MCTFYEWFRGNSSYPSCSIKVVVDVKDDKGDDLRSSVLRDLKQADPKKAENELIRRILEFFKGTEEGDIKMGESYEKVWNLAENVGIKKGYQNTISAFEDTQTLEEMERETGLSRERLYKIYANIGRMLQDG